MGIENNILFEDLRSQIIYLGVVRGFFLLYLYSFLAGALEWLFGTKKYKKEKRNIRFTVGCFSADSENVCQNLFLCFILSF